MKQARQERRVRQSDTNSVFHVHRALSGEVHARIGHAWGLTLRPSGPVVLIHLATLVPKRNVVLVAHIMIVGNGLFLFRDFLYLSPLLPGFYLDTLPHLLETRQVYET